VNLDANHEPPGALVTPELLRWARVSANETTETLAKACEVPPTEIAAWEAGAARPTIPQLRAFAKTCQRPIAIFFLDAIPATFPLPAEFRAFAKGGIETVSPRTMFAIRNAVRVREIVLDLPRDVAGASGLSGFTPPTDLSLDPEVAGRQFREKSGITVAQQIRWKSQSNALDAWREFVENQQVFVLQLRFPLEDARGFSIYSTICPIIVLNGADAATARSFTLFHELAHLLRGRSGVFRSAMAWETPRMDSKSGVAAVRVEREIENYCNRFAAAFLVPSGDSRVEQMLHSCIEDSRVSSDAVVKFANAMKVSRFVILRKLESRGLISFEMMRTLEEAWNETMPKSEDMPKPFGRPTEARKCVTRRGRTFVSLVLDAADADRITTADLSDFLGLRLKHLDAVREQLAA